MIKAPADVPQYDEDGAPLVGLSTNDEGRLIPQYGVAGQPGSRDDHAAQPATTDSGTGGSLWHGIEEAVPGMDRLIAASGAAGNKLGTAIGLNHSTESFGQIYDDVLRERQAQNAADADAHPYAYYGGELAGGLGLGGAVTKAAAALPLVGGAFEAAPAGASLAARAGSAIKQGTAIGALYGAGDAAPGQVGEGAALGALGGGALGAAAFPVAAAGGAVIRKLTQGADPELIDAFDRQNVTPMAAQVGGTASRAATAISRATIGGVPLADAARRSVATAQAAQDRIAAAIGRVTDDTGAGQAAQRGVESFIGSTLAKSKRLYNAIPIAGQRPAVLTNTKQALADLNAGLASNPQLSGQIADPRLQAYEEAIAGRTQNVPTGLVSEGGAPITRQVQKGGNLSWQDLQAFRSHIGERLGQPTLTSDTSTQALRKLYGALSEDMKATAAKEGPEALRAFNRANAYYRARQARIENVLKMLTGNDLNKSPEAAFKQVSSWAKEGGDSARLAQAMRSLPKDEANTVRASVFARLGDRNGDFSPAVFASQWEKLDPRAKTALFPDAHYQQDLKDIAKIAAAIKRAPEFTNHSGTAHAINGMQLAEEALDGHPLKAAGLGIAQYGVGRLLASPRFARWVAQSPRQAAGAPALAHVNRLTAIARAEPAIANEVLHLQQRLASAFFEAPTRAAADKQDKR
ncbi:hypothetical protein [Sphingomonas oligoaromativorans]|uniref:hypothetical protein n=1 Tax=Sphingomonas oligoaromativorans TaxID=575322 RepID=UPI001424553C|nr:hypothetical protein [Sphingomonas oligoaromativorans]NIJ32797.1 hypothetical protein [Sphingomonas oligoaromativorans]